MLVMAYNWKQALGCGQELLMYMESYQSLVLIRELMENADE